MEKNIYGISNYGSAPNYYHFLFGTLIPLLYYDIKTNSKYSYIMKIELGNMDKILKLIFGDRIKFNYIKSNLNSIAGDKYIYFNTYIDLLKNKNKNKSNILLDACDIFNEKYYKQINLRSFNENEYKEIEKMYISYYYCKNNFISTKCDESYLSNKKKYIKMKYTDKYIKLCSYYSYINIYFNSKISNKSTFSIILIERKIPKSINNSLINNYGGQRRIIYNHNQLKNKLSKLYNSKFKNIILENMTIYEQFNIFNNAKIIIGQHGGGLSNIFFCKKDTKIIEISPEWNDEYEFENLSKFGRLKYYKVNQNRMTKNEFELFNNKHNIVHNKEIDKIYKELDKPYNKYDDYPILSFIRNSGSVNVDEIISKIGI